MRGSCVLSQLCVLFLLHSQKYFSDFIEKYGFEDMYSGGFYPFESLEEHWAYWSRYILINRYMDCDNGTYQKLFELIKDKDYFVLTTNVDHQFQKAGFDKQRLFYTGLIPHCPVCGKPMTMNLRADDTFVQDDGWYRAAERYADFLRRHKEIKMLLLELGVGMNTPGIIKYPFWQMAAQNPNADYVSINAGEAYAPEEIRERAICVNGDIGEVICRCH